MKSLTLVALILAFSFAERIAPAEEPATPATAEQVAKLERQIEAVNSKIETEEAGKTYREWSLVGFTALSLLLTAANVYVLIKERKASLRSAVYQKQIEACQALLDSTCSMLWEITDSVVSRTGLKDVQVIQYYRQLMPHIAFFPPKVDKAAWAFDNKIQKMRESYPGPLADHFSREDPIVKDIVALAAEAGSVIHSVRFYMGIRSITKDWSNMLVGSAVVDRLEEIKAAIVKAATATKPDA